MDTNTPPSIKVFNIDNNGNSNNNINSNSNNNDSSNSNSNECVDVSPVLSSSSSTSSLMNELHISSAVNLLQEQQHQQQQQLTSTSPTPPSILTPPLPSTTTTTDTNASVVATSTLSVNTNNNNNNSSSSNSSSAPPSPNITSTSSSLPMDGSNVNNNNNSNSKTSSSPSTTTATSSSSSSSSSSTGSLASIDYGRFLRDIESMAIRNDNAPLRALQTLVEHLSAINTNHVSIESSQQFLVWIPRYIYAAFNLKIFTPELKQHFNRFKWIYRISGLDLHDCVSRSPDEQVILSVETKVDSQEFYLFEGSAKYINNEQLKAAGFSGFGGFLKNKQKPKTKDSSSSNGGGSGGSGVGSGSSNGAASSNINNPYINGGGGVGNGSSNSNGGNHSSNSSGSGSSSSSNNSSNGSNSNTSGSNSGIGSGSSSNGNNSGNSNNNGPAIDQQLLLNWILKHEIVETFCKISDQPDIIRHGLPVMIFLCQFGKLENHQLELLWNSSIGKHESVRSTIYNALLELFGYLHLEQLDYFYEYFNKSIVGFKSVEFDNDLLQFIYNLSMIAIQHPENVGSSKKSYGLDLFWKLLQDRDQNITFGHGDNVAQSLINRSKTFLVSLLRLQECAALRMTYIELAIENIKTFQSVYQSLSLIVNIVELFVKKQRATIESLENKYKLFDLFFKEIANFKKVIAQRSSTLSFSSLEGVNYNILYGSFQHLPQIQARFEFLEYILSQSSIMLNIAQLDILWEAFVTGAITPEEKEACFIWLKNTKIQGKERIAFPEQVVRYLFLDKMANLDWSIMGLSSYSVFERYFLYVNERSGKIKKIANSIFTGDLFSNQLGLPSNKPKALQLQGQQQSTNSNQLQPGQQGQQSSSQSMQPPHSPSLSPTTSPSFHSANGYPYQNCGDSTQPSDYYLVSLDLLGIQQLWSAALGSLNLDVSDQAINTLNTLYQSGNDKGSSKFKDEYLRVCMDHIVKSLNAKNNQQTVSHTSINRICRALFMIKTFANTESNKQSKDDAAAKLSNCTPANADKQYPYLVKLDRGDSYAITDITGTDTLRMFKRKVAAIYGNPRPAVRSLRIFLGDKELKDDDKCMDELKIFDSNGAQQYTLLVKRNSSSNISSNNNNSNTTTTTTTNNSNNNGKEDTNNKKDKKSKKDKSDKGKSGDSSKDSEYVDDDDDDYVEVLDDTPIVSMVLESIQHQLGGLGLTGDLQLRKVQETKSKVVAGRGKIENSLAILISKPQYFDQIFNLLDFDNEIAEGAWNVVSELPMNTKVVNEIKNFKETLIPNNSIYKSIYYLKALDSILDGSFESGQSNANGTSNKSPTGSDPNGVLEELKNNFIKKGAVIYLTQMLKDITIVPDRGHLKLFNLLLKNLFTLSLINTNELSLVPMYIFKREAVPMFESPQFITKLFQLLSSAADLQVLLNGNANESTFNDFNSMYYYAEQFFCLLSELVNIGYPTSNSPAPSPKQNHENILLDDKGQLQIVSGQQKNQQQQQQQQQNQQLHPNDNLESQDFVKTLLSNLIKELMNMPIREISSNQTKDHILVGILNIIRNLCLFKTPTANDHGLELPPLCKTKESRLSCYRLMKEFAKNDHNNFFLIERLINEEMDRVDPTSDWNYSPIDREKSIYNYVGLKNQGTTCYMNSLLQQLYHSTSLKYSLLNIKVPTFNELILRIQQQQQQQSTEGSSPQPQQQQQTSSPPQQNSPSQSVHPPHVQPSPEQIQQTNLLNQVQYLFIYLQESSKRYYDSINFCKSITNYDGSPINLGVQMDAYEFFHLFLDKMEVALKNISPEHKGILNEAFGGVFTNQFIPRECSHRSHCEEPFFSISLEVKNKRSVLESLDLFVQEESLKDYKCDSCNSKIEISKRCLIDKLPNTLILHLKRFEFDLENMRNIKLNDYCEFPQQINMAPYTKESVEQSSDGGPANGVTKKSSVINHLYELNGIVLHQGTADSGHYITLVKDATGNWFELNDTFVLPYDFRRLEQDCFGGFDDVKEFDKVQQKQVMVRRPKTGNAYMLFYKRSDNSNDHHSQCKPIAPAAKEAKIPKEVLETVWNENRSFLLEKYLFDSDFSTFIWDIVNLNHDPTFDPVIPTKSTTVHSSANQLTILSSIKLTTRYIIDIYSHSKERNLLDVWAYHLKRLMRESIQGAEWFIRYLIDKNLLKGLLLGCFFEKTRQTFVDIITFAILLRKNTLAEQQQQQQSTTPPKDMMSTTMVSFYNTLISLTKSIRDYPKRTIQQLFSLLLNVITINEKEKEYILQRGTYMPNSIGGSTGIISNSSNYQPAMYGQSSGTSSHLGGHPSAPSFHNAIYENLETPQSNTTYRIQPPAGSPRHSLVLSETTLVAILSKSFLLKLIKENGWCESVRQLIGHLSWNNRSISTHFFNIIKEILLKSSPNIYQYVYPSLTSLLEIKDPQTEWRIDTIMQSLLKLPESMIYSPEGHDHFVRYLSSIAVSNPKQPSLIVSEEFNAWRIKHKDAISKLIKDGYYK
ncbi:hypothetical protein PPL_05027 [Heterostelium album PN500]|uniref:USP domain-containing protein n=1 Tax=Heterostelium pallidum (strain ATCC 26659 / Pp 5 / PN500) TaxID=670386 RepID=D3B983_HETP5|nr:hypothetical protein PPL_05027 [Heterostelium album PN500]EFA82122.1 hypothetical protein PPL_05027 [Heterostelium album PN500]|eukprot:XP_020434239.1 hypothetical protein PPL_05027 [Heterostelium album PN500]